ncbi:MAG: hypothetical protein HRT61_02485 [Ekhidna sp.]|nr:hypothetical protein [Ekhidna sp.]
MKNYLLLLTITFIAASCSNDSSIIPENQLVLNLPEKPFDYIMDNDQAVLGRVLFYDKQLSINNGVSCASCHKQALAFADNKQFSPGFDNRPTERNSMPIQNLLGSDIGFGFRQDMSGVSLAGLFWDGRGINHSEALLLPVINHVEMGIPNIDYLTEKVSSIDYYDELFAKAFPGQQIDGFTISSSLFSFTHSITSFNTKLDKSLRGDVELSPNEKLGQALFFTKYECNSCHQVQDPQGYLFAGGFANIGLESNYADSGLEGISDRSFDNGKFKIPSLRNVALTAPYMHDGRFASLQEVILHYKSEVVDHPNLDHRLKGSDGVPLRPEITESEVQLIVDFLGTLTDHSLIADERFSNPFVVE